ncbi:MAG: uroporphyrinogen decarboxylase family protein [Bacteroidota bacterium]
MGRFKELIERSHDRVPLPIATYPAIALTGHSIKQLVTDAALQSSAQLTLHRHLKSDVLFTCMDLSVEAEEFGATVRYSDAEVPSVVGRKVTSLDEIEALAQATPGHGRTAVYIDTVRRLRAASGECPILAGMIGPFSLACRLFGVSECFLATATEPEIVESLLERTTQFLLAYANEYKRAGADGVFIAEPTAGLLSPKSLGTYSSPHIKRIIEGAEDDAFDIILHNCGAKSNHLGFLEESGASIFHFGATMDIVAALQKLSAHAIVCGNLDPAAVFVQSSVAELRQKTIELLGQTRAYPRFVPSSGCDVPAGTSLDHLQAFLDVVRREGSDGQGAGGPDFPMRTTTRCLTKS